MHLTTTTVDSVLDCFAVSGSHDYGQSSFLFKKEHTYNYDYGQETDWICSADNSDYGRGSFESPD